MEVEVTSSTAKTARSYKLEPEELAFADLVATGWEPEDAWAVAIRKGATWNRTARKEAITQLMEKETTQQRIEDTKGILSKAQTERIRAEINADSKALFARATDKTSKIVELQAKLEACKDTGEWLKINQQIIDVTRMKQEETKKDGNTTHFFLPTLYPESCEYCLRNPKNKNK